MTKVKKKKKSTTHNVLNRRASFDYALGDELVLGIVLTGPETRAARDAHVQLKGSYVTVRDDELWLNNASFSIMNNQKNLPGSRSIIDTPCKLLASKKQIASLAEEKKAGLSIVPIKLLTSKKYIKLVVALGKGKKRYDKRETLKRKDQEREAMRLTRGKI